MLNIMHICISNYRSSFTVPIWLFFFV